MISRLVACAACSRHIRSESERCPFCDAPHEATARENVVAPSMRLSSVGVMTFRAAALGVALSACGGNTEEPSGQGGAAGSATSGGSTASGGTIDDGSGGRVNSGGTGGTIEVGGFGGTPDGVGGSPVPVYRATPRG
ncbi:MAG: hypothetical protein ACOY0T_16455 [Myxococcota bacterium]